MNKITSIGFSVVLSFTTSLYAADTTPTMASVNRLLQLSNSQNIIDQVFQQMQVLSKEASASMNIPDADKAIVANYQLKVTNLIKNNFSWDKIKNEVAAVYIHNFTQKEIDAMLRFYETAEGQSMLKKMPQVSQESMYLILQKTNQLQPQIEQIMNQMQNELKANKR